VRVWGHAPFFGGGPKGAAAAAGTADCKGHSLPDCNMNTQTLFPKRLAGFSLLFQ
jgi:hypothetical protein